MDQTKIKQIEKAFSQLYGVNSNEIEGFMAEIRGFSEVGLDAVLQYLSDAKSQQNKLIGKMAETDKDFLPNLSNFLNTSSKKIKDEFEESEKQSADDLLQNL